MAAPSRGGQKAVQKVILIGDTNVGKTSLVDRYINGKFVGSHKSTIGAEFNPIDVQVDDVSVSVQVWDTAGQERFASLGNAFYRGADSCVLVYDVTNASSFARIWSDWRRKFIERAGIVHAEEFPMIVLGNKSDVEKDKYAVAEAKAREVCEKNGIPHMLVSAKTGFNVDQAFLAVVRAALKRPKAAAAIPDNLVFVDAPAPPPESGCPC